MKKRKIIILLGILFVFILSMESASADCRGCCSGHGGVVCRDGITMCGDGSSLSAKCGAKGCDKCGGYDVPSSYDRSIKNHATNVRVSCSANKYNRKNWPHWIDEDGDCQNTRAEILIRDNIGKIKFKRNKPCNVSWGKWKCPYTGKLFTKSSDIDIDHIVSLANAFKTGGANWSREKKRQFANDPMNLLAVEDNVNQQKSDKGPDEWRPPLKEYWPEFAKKWRKVKNKYGLMISNSEERALKILEQSQGN